MMTKIFVVVLVKDGMSTLPAFIEGIKKQTLFKEKEDEFFFRKVHME
jgi:hypothetical protein